MVNYPISVSLNSVSVKRRGKSVLGPLSLDFKVDGFNIVLGPNGAGKTTFLKVLHGVERVSYGTVKWSIPDAKARQSQAYVFQSPIMLRRSVRQNLAYPLQLVGMDKAEITTRVVEWAQKIGLQDVLDFPAPRLSGGEQQMLALGRGLMALPKVLLLDEPTLGLAPAIAKQVFRIVPDLRNLGITIVIAEQDLHRTLRVANFAYVLEHGAVAAKGTGKELINDPIVRQAYLGHTT